MKKFDRSERAIHAKITFLVTYSSILANTWSSKDKSRQRNDRRKSISYRVSYIYIYRTYNADKCALNRSVQRSGPNVGNRQFTFSNSGEQRNV